MVGAMTTVLAGALTACASSSAASAAGTPSPRPILDGKYSFSERPVSTAPAIEGTLMVVADTVLVDLLSGPCRSILEPSTRPRGLAYDCADVTLYFDRDDPVNRASYSMQTTVTDKKNVCVRYGTNAQGQQICLENKIETVERKVTKSGRLRLHRLTALSAERQSGLAR